MKTKFWMAVAATGVLLLGACGDDDSGGGADPAATGDDVATGDDATTDDADSGGGDDTTDGDTGGDGDILDEAGEAIDNVIAGEAGTGTITVGDQTWEFQLFDTVPTASCDPDFFGGFVAFLTSGDDILQPLDSMSVMLPGGNFTDPPNVKLRLAVDAEVEWLADETVYENYPSMPAGIGVTDFAIDGATASGTAMFIDEETMFQANAGTIDAPTILEGSFSVTCG